MTPQDVQQQEFDRAKRGLDPQQVGTFLDRVAASIAARDRALHEARTEIEALERAVANVKQNEEAFRLTMMAATEAKEEMLRQASQEAARIEEEARATAELLAERAQVDSDDRTSSLRREIALLEDEKVRLQAELADIHGAASDSDAVEDAAAGQEIPGRPPLELVVDRDRKSRDRQPLTARVGDLRA